MKKFIIKRKHLSLKPRQSTRSAPDLPSSENYNDSTTWQDQGDNYIETALNCKEVDSSISEAVRNNPDGDTITPSMSADSATDSTSLSSGELSIELKEANEEDEWSMLDDIISYMEEKDEFREITELLSKTVDDQPINNQMQELEEKLKKTEEVLLETQNRYMRCVDDLSGGDIKQETYNKRAEIEDEQTSLADSREEDDDQTLVGDASSVGELPDDCCSISSPPAFQRKMIPGNVDGYRTRSRSPYLKETRSRFAYDKVYHTPYTEHSYQPKVEQKGYRECIRTLYGEVQSELEERIGDYVVKREPSAHDLVKMRPKSYATPVIPIEYACHPDGTVRAKDRAKDRAKENTLNHKVTRAELEALNMGEMWEMLKNVQGVGRSHSVESQSAEVKVDVNGNQASSEHSITRPDVDDFHLEQMWDQMKEQLNIAQSYVMEYGDNLRGRMTEEIKEMKSVLGIDANNSTLTEEPVVVPTDVEQPEQLNSTPKHPYREILRLNVKQMEDQPKMAKVQDRPLEEQASLTDQDDGLDLEFPLIDAYNRFSSVVAVRKVKKVPSFEKWISSVTSVASRIKEMSDSELYVAPPRPEPSKMPSDAETYAGGRLPQVPVRKSASDKRDKIMNIRHLLLDEEPKQVTKPVDNRSLEECNAILFREYYDKQFAKKRQWLSDVIQDRVAKEEFCHSVVNSVSSSVSQISEKPSLLTNRSEQLLSARPLRKLDVEALLSDISARSDTSLPRSSKKLRNNSLKTSSCQQIQAR